MRLQHLMENFAAVGVVFDDQDGETGKIGTPARGRHPHKLARDHGRA